MANIFEKLSWVIMLILSLVTFGLYIPFWFKKIKRSTDGNQETLSGDAIFVLLIISVLIPFFSISLTMTIDGALTSITTNIFGIGTILNVIRIMLIVYLSFSLRNILKNQYKKEIHPLYTLLFGPFYIQHRINSLNVSKIGGRETVSVRISAEVARLVEYLKENQDQGFSAAQLREGLLEQGFSIKDITLAMDLLPKKKPLSVAPVQNKQITTIIIFMVIVIGCLIVGFVVVKTLFIDSSTSTTEPHLLSPFSSGDAIWNCLIQDDPECLTTLSLNEVQVTCSSLDPNCEKRFIDLKKEIVATRGVGALKKNNYKIEIAYQDSESATVLVYAPKDINWPINITLQKESGEWRNKEIITS